jgi:hypothetical protein
MKRMTDHIDSSKGILLRTTGFASNMTVAEYSCGMEIMISYKTPVAGKNRLGWFRTDAYHSVTTTSHINKYGARAGRIVEQGWIEKMHN